MSDDNRYQIQSIDFDQAKRRLFIIWKDGHESRYPYIWLRHDQFFPTLGRNDQDDNGCYTVHEKTHSPAIAGIEVISLDVEITWSHDNSQTMHSLRELRDGCLSSAAREERQFNPDHWMGADAQEFKWFNCAELENVSTRMDIFEQIRNYGIVLLNQVPCVSGTIEKLAQYFGPVRTTHFGKLFDIRSLPDDQQDAGENIGATASNAQAPHMDEGWRHGPTGLSFYHCLKAHPSGGGASIFIDGIAAAEALRISNPESFKLLSTVPVNWAAERNPKERFRTRGRLIATDFAGVVRGVRLSDRNLPPLDLPEHQIEPAYEALRHFCEVAYNRDREFEHLFQPGEMAIFDNHRILHARRSFDPSAGERWIQQLSVDREEFHNEFRQLAESQNRTDLSFWEPDAGVLSQSS